MARREAHDSSDTTANQYGPTILVAPASPGSLGDEAMVTALAEELRTRGVNQRIVATWRAEDDWRRAASFSGQIVLPHADPSQERNFTKALESAGTIYSLGADVLDGGYGANHSLIMLRAAHFGAERGLRSIIIGSSFREDIHPEVIHFLKRLDPRVKILARDARSQVSLQQLLEREVPLVADIAFLLKPDHQSPAVVRAAE